MASNKSKYLNEENVASWLSALGFSFPRNEAEEKIFDKLYADYDFKLKGMKIDATRLIQELEGDAKDNIIESEWKMAARNYGELPKHIIERMKKNQNGKEGSSKKD